MILLKNWKFYGLRDVNRKNSGFHLIRNYPGIPVYATNFRIIPFPKWKYFSGKMETLDRTKSLIDSIGLNNTS